MHGEDGDECWEITLRCDTMMHRLLNDRPNADERPSLL
jgi:hypothetical protein